MSVKSTFENGLFDVPVSKFASRRSGKLSGVIDTGLVGSFGEFESSLDPKSTLDAKLVTPAFVNPSDGLWLKEGLFLYMRIINKRHASPEIKKVTRPVIAAPNSPNKITLLEIEFMFSV